LGWWRRYGRPEEEEMIDGEDDESGRVVLQLKRKEEGAFDKSGRQDLFRDRR
jgi:hypothetical protein